VKRRRDKESSRGHRSLEVEIMEWDERSAESPLSNTIAERKS
jgi:hypothetical protein